MKHKMLIFDYYVSGIVHGFLGNVTIYAPDGGGTHPCIKSVFNETKGVRLTRSYENPKYMFHIKNDSWLVRQRT